MSKGSLFVSLLAILFASGCATLFQGTHEEIMVASDPAGAQVSVNDGRNGMTPYSMKVSRDDDLDIHVSKPGYASTDIADESHIEWGYFVSDIFFTGLIGLAVDGIDGAMFYHNQTMVSAHLDPITAPYPQSDQASPQASSVPGAGTVPAVASVPPVATFAAVPVAAPVANGAQPQTSLRPATSAVTTAISVPAAATVPATTQRPPVVNPQVGDQWQSSDHPD